MAQTDCQLILCFIEKCHCTSLTPGRNSCSEHLRLPHCADRDAVPKMVGLYGQPWKNLATGSRSALDDHSLIMLENWPDTSGTLMSNDPRLGPWGFTCTGVVSLIYLIILVLYRSCWLHDFNDCMDFNGEFYNHQILVSGEIVYLDYYNPRGLGTGQYL